MPLGAPKRSSYAVARLFPSSSIATMRSGCLAACSGQADAVPCARPTALPLKRLVVISCAPKRQCRMPRSRWDLHSCRAAQSDSKEGPSTLGRDAQAAVDAVANPETAEQQEQQGQEVPAPMEQLEVEWDEGGLVEPPASVNGAAAASFGALGLAYMLAGVGLAAAAVSTPGLLVPVEPGASSAWAATMLGCVAAGCVRGAGVAFHLRQAAQYGELLCWRHQHISLSLVLYSVAALSSQLLGPASPQLAALTALLCGATVFVCGTVARSALQVHPFIAATYVEGAPLQSLGRLAACLLGHMRTVAGVLLLGAAALAWYGAWHVLVALPGPSWVSAGGPLAAPSGPWPDMTPGYSVAAAGLRRLVGAGMALLALTARGLLDYADQVRVGRTVQDLVQQLQDNLTAKYDGLSKYYMMDSSPHIHLNLAFVAGAALQAWFVARAPSLGVDVNWDTALWGPLYGTWFLGLLYGLVVLTRFDWTAAAGAVISVVDWLGTLAHRIFGRLFWQWEWATIRNSSASYNQ